MRIVMIGAAGLLSIVATTSAGATVPNPVTALLGPSIGYLLAQSDLCQWALTDRIRTTYQNAFEQMGMTAAQQASVWQQAAARQNSLANLPAKAKAGMEADTCTPAFRARVEHDLAE